METNNSEEQRYLRAKKKVDDMKGFYTHLIVYCLVIPFIIFINLRFVPQFHWFWFSVLGWGFGLFCHWLNVFGFNLFGFGDKWRERKIQEYMNDNY